MEKADSRRIKKLYPKAKYYWTYSAHYGRTIHKVRNDVEPEETKNDK
jgi:hypothetical protein